MSISKGFYSIGEGFASMFDWMFPSPKMKTYRDMTKELDEKMQDLYDKQGWGEYHNPMNEWVVRYNPANEWDEWTIRYNPAQLPDPIQVRTPIRCPARKYNRK